MKIRVRIGDLVDYITQAAITIDRKAMDQPSGKVYLRARIKTEADGDKFYLYLYSNNQASKTFTRVEITEVEQEGETLIDPDKLLGGLQGRNPDQIATLHADGEKKKTQVKIGSSKFHVPFDAAVDIMAKAVKNLPTGKAFSQVPASVLLEFIRRSSFCIPSGANGQQRFAMDVLALSAENGRYEARATDGHIICTNSAKIEDDTNLQQLLLPQEALVPLQKLLQKHKDQSVDLVQGRTTPEGALQEVFFRMGTVLFGSSLRSGKFPNVSLVMRGHQPAFHAVVSRDLFKGSVVRGANFVENSIDKRWLKLVLVQSQEPQEQALRVRTSNTISDFDDQIEISEVKGELRPMAITVNIDYMGSIAGSVQSETLQLGFSPDNSKALVIQDESDKGILTQYAVMPINNRETAGNE